MGFCCRAVDGSYFCGSLIEVALKREADEERKRVLQLFCEVFAALFLCQRDSRAAQNQQNDYAESNVPIFSGHLVVLAWLDRRDLGSL
jgi:hypothetical protein